MADSDVDQLNQEVWQAERARQLMQDPIMQKILSETERQLILAIKSAQTPDQAFKASIALQVFSVIGNSMEAMVQSGRMAAIQLEEKRKWFDKLRR